MNAYMLQADAVMYQEHLKQHLQKNLADRLSIISDKEGKKNA